MSRRSRYGSLVQQAGGLNALAGGRARRDVGFDASGAYHGEDRIIPHRHTRACVIAEAAPPKFNQPPKNPCNLQIKICIVGRWGFDYLPPPVLAHKAQKNGPVMPASNRGRTNTTH